MKLERCPKGHYYDGDIYTHCPHCGVSLSMNISQITGTDKTVAMYDSDKTIAMNKCDDEITISGLIADEDDRTVGIYTTAFSGNPVVGWLVCCDGPEKGRDYRLYPAKNRIGRSSGMEVMVCDDMEISRDNHITVLYEPRKNEFYAVAGNGICSVNGVILENSMRLNEGDLLSIGASSFEFIPYCKGDKKWDLKD